MMATHKIVFNALLGAMCVYALLRGGQPEKLTALGWAVGCIATFALPFHPDKTFHQVDLPRFAVDVAVLFWFVGIAMFANRFWPMWLAAVHLLAIATHGVKAYQPDLLASIYALAVGKIAYPMLILIVVAIARHQDRMQRYGEDRDWSVPRRAA